MKQDDGEKEEKSFAELLEESPMPGDRLKPGDRLEAKVVRITPEWIFIDLDGKTEGYLDSGEVQDKSGNITLNVGDRIWVYFLWARDGEKHFTTHIKNAEAARNYLEYAARSGIAVEGTVEKEIKGGFLIKFKGNIRAFCPYSQMELGRIENPSEYVGKNLDFVVTGYTRRGRSIYLSRRPILEANLEKKRKELWDSLREGARIMGKITSIHNFGAFADINGLQGLIPASEIDWARVKDIHDVLSVGQDIEVVIVKLDQEKKRITLSRKGVLPDPWENAELKYPTGSRHIGYVSRVVPFGVFVTLEPGVDGLIRLPRRKEGEKRGRDMRDKLKEGQSIEVKIENVIRDKKRISLAVMTEKEESACAEDRRGHAQKPPRGFGSLGDVLRYRMQKRKDKK